MRRNTWVILGAMVAALAWSGGAAAQYPAKALRLVVPYPPGGSADVLARTLGQQVSSALGRAIVVDNKPGAGTAIGARDVAASAPDGYTIMMGTVSSHAMTPLINPQANYDPIKDFAPVAPIASIPFAMLVHPSVPAKSLQEFIALAKSQPGKLSYASAGVGTSNHLAGELLSSTVGIDLVHVPYKGSAPALADLLGGRVNAMFDLLLTATKQVAAGNARALAVTASSRSSLLPEVPTFAEAGVPNYSVSAWFGIFAPAGTPAQAVERLNAEFRNAVHAPETLKRLAGMGADPLDGSPQQFAAFVRHEYETWGGVIKRTNMQAQGK